MNTETAINISRTAFDLLEGHSIETKVLWLSQALTQLRPGQRVQVIELNELKPREKKNLAELVQLGLLRPTRHSATKYYVPRALAFASAEPTIQALMEANP